jgi:hypothetical protein
VFRKKAPRRPDLPDFIGATGEFKEHAKQKAAAASHA